MLDAAPLAAEGSLMSSWFRLALVVVLILWPDPLRAVEI
jgi:hypothetical protein